MKVSLVSYPERSGYCIADELCDMAARTCVSPEAPELFTYDDEGHPEHSDCKALRAATSSGHESVLEHAVFTFMVSGVSRTLTHQLVRHRIASYSQQSQRYVKMAVSSRDPFGYVVPESIRDDQEAYQEYERLMMAIAEVYGRLVDCHKVPMEDARYVLPNACCTDIVITMNARELMHFFGLRCCSRTQWEIRELAERMLDEVRKVAPIMFEKAGPRCIRLGYCPETRSCGRMPPLEELEEEWWIGNYCSWSEKNFDWYVRYDRLEEKRESE